MFSFCHLAWSTWVLLQHVFLLSLGRFNLGVTSKCFPFVIWQVHLGCYFKMFSFCHLACSTWVLIPKFFSSRFARKHKVKCFPFVLHNGFPFVISYSSSSSSSIEWGSGIPKSILFQNLSTGCVP